MVKGMGYGIQHRQMSKTITNKKNEIYPTRAFQKVLLE